MLLNMNWKMPLKIHLCIATEDRFLVCDLLPPSPAPLARAGRGPPLSARTRGCGSMQKRCFFLRGSGFARGEVGDHKGCGCENNKLKVSNPRTIAYFHLRSPRRACKNLHVHIPEPMSSNTSAQIAQRFVYGCLLSMGYYSPASAPTKSTLRRRLCEEHTGRVLSYKRVCEHLMYGNYPVHELDWTNCPY